MDATTSADRGPVWLDGVVALAGGFPLLAETSLDIATGEVVVVDGPNGAGKTSLLRVCAGLIPIARGHGEIAGCDLHRQRDQIRRRVGFLGHHNGLYGDLTAAENIALWGALVAATDHEIALAQHRLGLGGRLATTPAGDLSAGQQRRTALACLMVRRAELWLLDEPYAGLDATARDEVDALIGDAGDAGVTVIVASHDPVLVSGRPDRWLTMVGGRVVDERTRP
ncbi:MAG: heme ABC exporter ATP-binding protein CcmA [Ilumatobacter coccineus]|uniref:Heme ABC exporter ATP-binding protein CcmA n=1 Tax=Ilumatobacter coccineus TaxID=467094 RepID=A0A2G6K711_9ACTN|nr:MAG: heme ABC exporter ATP-binding protein CcmA [Ilumatobacter coccineus]